MNVLGTKGPESETNSGFLFDSCFSRRSAAGSEISYLTEAPNPVFYLDINWL